MTPYLPFPGEISRKRRRHWKRQVLRGFPGLNPAWLDARFEIEFQYADGSRFNDSMPIRTNKPAYPKTRNEMILSGIPGTPERDDEKALKLFQRAP